MNLPLHISSDYLRRLAPNDTRIVRVLLRLVHSSGTYRLRGKKRTYFFVHNAKVGCHVLDVPESVWNDGIPAGKYKENFSVAHDLFANISQGNAPLIPVLLRVGEDVPAELHPADVSAVTHLRTLLSFLGAPDEVREAFAMIERGESHLLGGYVESIIGPQVESLPSIPDIEISDEGEDDPAAAAKAERARKMREAKARKRAEAASSAESIV
jgi:hypothetical protein